MVLTNEDLLSMYRYMLMGRTIEQAIGKIRGTYHPALGEEAVIVGAFYNLRDEDVVVPHYRGAMIAHYLRGASLGKMMAGLDGRKTSCSHGRWRSDVCGSFEFNTFGLFGGTLGPSISLGTGAALAAKLKKTDNVAVIAFGEGTSNRGEFHEAINLASVLKLPAVYVCQNNQFAISTPASRALGCRSVADRAIGYGIPGIEVDGNDTVAVHEVVQEAVKRAREGGGPTLIEALTYRIGGHWIIDTAPYRPAGEAEEWKKKDPIARLQKRLIETGVLTESKVEEMRRAMEEEAASLLKKAGEAPWPGEDVLGLDEVFAPTSTGGESK